MKNTNILLLSSSILVTSLFSSALTIGGVWYLLQTFPQYAPQSSGIQNTNNQPHIDKNQTNTNFSLSSFFSEENDSNQPKSPQFHTLEKLVFSVKGKRQNHLVMVRVALQTHNPELVSDIDNYMPIVQNELFKLFSEKKREDVEKSGAFSEIQQEIKDTLLTRFSHTTFVDHIDDVLLTKLVVQ